MLTLNSILKSLKKLVNEEFECPICLELCSDTHLIPDCGHRFCGKCIRESIRKCNHECPTCRFPIATHRSCRQDPQFDRMLQRLATELIEPLEKQMIAGQNGTEEAKDLNEDRKIAAPSQSEEDFEVPVKVEVPIPIKVSTQEEQKVNPYGQATRKRNRVDEDKDEQQKKPTNSMSVIVTLRPTHLLDEDERHIPLECEMLQLPTTPNRKRRSKRFRKVKATMEVVKKDELKQLLDEDKKLPCQEEKIRHTQPTRSPKLSFDERFKDLIRFKREFGHCRVSRKQNFKDDKYYPLGCWVSNMRRSYKRLQRGEHPGQKLSKAQIKRLDDIGFEWESQRYQLIFDYYCTNLLEFKEEYGHCRVPCIKRKDAKYFALGHFVSNMRSSYRAIQRGEIPLRNLNESEIKRLEDIGFEWKSTRIIKTFDDYYADLLMFKEEFGHCYVIWDKSKLDAKYHSLSNWVTIIRSTYRAIQSGTKPKRKLSKSEIKRLEDIGFEWETSYTRACSRKKNIVR